jgi:ABC-2 type transport system ATP-binding protein
MSGKSVMNGMMEINGLSKSYNNTTVLDIDHLAIQTGRFYAIVGENGAGKTTLFRILAGLTPPTGGTVTLSDNNGSLGVMIERPAVELNMTAKENLLWASKLYGEDKCEKIDEILEMVNLSTGKKKVKAFSLGMKQRLGIAMSLIHDPDLMILDEPMNGLDPTGMVELRNILLNINKCGTTIILSSHMLEEVYKMATDYIFIKNGKIVKNISMSEMEDLETFEHIIRTTDNERTLGVLQNDFNCNTRIRDNEIMFDMQEENIRLLSKKLSEEDIYILGLYKKSFNIEEYYMDIMKDH